MKARDRRFKVSLRAVQFFFICLECLHLPCFDLRTCTCTWLNQWIPRLRTAIYHTGLDVKNESHPVGMRFCQYQASSATLGCPGVDVSHVMHIRNTDIHVHVGMTHSKSSSLFPACGAMEKMANEKQWNTLSSIQDSLNPLPGQVCRSLGQRGTSPASVRSPRGQFWEGPPSNYWRSQELSSVSPESTWEGGKGREESEWQMCEW